MRLEMRFQERFLAERFTASFTREWFAFQMHDFMVLSALCTLEPCWTLRTLVGPFIGVGAGVLLQQTGLEEAFAAHRAHVGAHIGVVPPHVVEQFAVREEGLLVVALLARVPSDALVPLLVVPEALLVLERLSAPVAREGLRRGVRLDVMLVRAQVLELTATLGAHVLLAHGLVPHQSKLGDATLFAFGTRKAGVRVGIHMVPDTGLIGEGLAAVLTFIFLRKGFVQISDTVLSGVKQILNVPSYSDGFQSGFLTASDLQNDRRTVGILCSYRSQEALPPLQVVAGHWANQ